MDGKKSMKRWILLGCFLLWPTLLLAQSSNSSLFHPDAIVNNTDLSLIYLGDMFGVVGTVLNGNGSQLLGQLFGVFNGAVLILGGISVFYTFMIGTVQTAHEGEVLGKEWSSVWIPFRVVIGTALLIPNSVGYSYIQIFMMWVIVNGIGVADSTWNAALDYLNKDGIIISQNYAANQNATGDQKIQNPGPMVGKTAMLLRSLTCVEMLQYQINQYIAYQVKHNQTPLSTPPTSFINDITNAINDTKKSQSSSYTVLFPTSNYYGTNGACGKISWNSTATTASNQLSGSKVLPQILATLQGDTSRTDAIVAAIADLDKYAQQIASNYTLASPEALGVATGAGTWGSPTANGSYLIPGSLLGDAASAYFGVMSQATRLINNALSGNSAVNAWTGDAEAKGWALAGAYYFNLVAANNKVNSIVDSDTPTISPPSPDITQVPQIVNYLGGPSSTFVGQMQALLNGQPGSNNSNDYIVAPDSAFIVGAQAYGAQLNYGSSNVVGSGNLANLGSGGSVPGDGNTARLVGPLNSVTSSVAGFLGSLGNIANSETNNENPVLAIATFGNDMVNATFGMLQTMALAGFLITLGLGLMPFDSLGAAGVSIVTAVFNFLTPILVSLLTVGLTMGYYIPMIPFIMFSFGVIGWFVAVIEAILAGPIVALGISHPEGSNPILGKADPAVALLVNVFLRPAFMIFGLIIGMMISYVGLWLVNQGFGLAFTTATQTAGGGSSSMFKPIACLIIYVVIVMQILQKSFSLIHVIPDNVLRWIGMEKPPLMHEGEDVKAIGEGVKHGLGTAAQTAGNYTKAATELGSPVGSMVKEIVKAIVTRGKGGGAAMGAMGAMGGGGAGGRGGRGGQMQKMMNQGGGGGGGGAGKGVPGASGKGEKGDRGEKGERGDKGP
jgi:defect-in-organelle-trafficking protein DotA